MIEALLTLDVKLFYLINGARSQVLDKLLPLFSDKNFLYGLYITLFFIALFLLFKIKKITLKRSLVLIIFFILGFGMADFSCGKVLKPLFQRERPFATLPKVYFYTEDRFRYVETPLTYKKTLSFPSCHATNAGFGSSFLSFLSPPLSPLFILSALLVGYSRIYLGHHFPLDVLFGYLLGFIIALFLNPLLKGLQVIKDLSKFES
ncbi:MAG: phosphatase PAP2 family protein [Caldimicrobium sp.]